MGASLVSDASESIALDGPGSAVVSGRVGAASYTTTSHWSDGSFGCDSTFLHLYCVEQ